MFAVGFLATVVLYLWWRSCSGEEGLTNASSHQEKILEQTVRIQGIYDKVMKVDITPEVIKELKTTIAEHEKSLQSLNLILQKEKAAKQAYPGR